MREVGVTAHALLGLSEKGRQLAQFILAGIRRGLSANRLEEILRGQGLSYRRSDFLSDVRILRGVAEAESYLKFVPKDKLPSERLYLPSRLYVPEKYLTTLRLELRNTITGERATRFVGVTHDQLLTPRQLEELYKEKTYEWGTRTRYEEKGWVAERVVPVFGRRRI